MNRAEFVNNFSKRLNFFLQREEYFPNGPKAGAKISELAIAAGVSYQMARKYILGMALPEYHILLKIAKWLRISPSWLLFGEDESKECITKSPTLIEIETELLKQILHRCIILFPSLEESEKVINYIVDIIYDASHIEADDKTILKIIDMILNSNMQFKLTHFGMSA